MRLRYEEHTWPELRELAKRDDLVGGDPRPRRSRTTATTCRSTPTCGSSTPIASARSRPAAGQALLFPTQVHGYTPHHLDFPGSVTLRWNVFVEALLDQGRSLCRHGFDRILIVNGHGSNQPLVDIAARLIGLEHRERGLRLVLLPPVGAAARRSSPRCATRRTPAAWPRVRARDLDVPGHRAGARADGQGGPGDPRWDSEHVWLDWSDGPLAVWPHWSGLSESGVVGDATVATREKGEDPARGRRGGDRGVHRGDGHAATTSREGSPCQLGPSRHCSRRSR
jgi:creatinine amidohydrolase